MRCNIVFIVYYMTFTIVWIMIDSYAFNYLNGEFLRSERPSDVGLNFTYDSFNFSDKLSLNLKFHHDDLLNSCRAERWHDWTWSSFDRFYLFFSFGFVACDVTFHCISAHLAHFACVYERAKEKNAALKNVSFWLQRKFPPKRFYDATERMAYD